MARSFDRIRNRLQSEQGIALVAAVGIAFVLSATVTSTIAFSSAQDRTVARSTADQVALSLAEAGLNNALAQLHAAANPSMTSALPTADAPATQTLAGGTAQWFGELSAQVWSVVGIGRVANPTPGLPDVVRRVSARVRLGGSTQGSANNAVWNYVYADDPSTCTTLGNSVEINVPLYLRGSLCLNNSARITGYALQVGGTVTINNTATVGTSAAPITEAHIAGGCRIGNTGPYNTPCSAADRIFATNISSAPTGLTKPPVDLPYWYENAKPGPKQPCTVGSVPGGFDNDGVLNRSRAAFELTPPTAYDCRVYDANGVLVGQLSWQPGEPGLLTIAGTIFFDGDVWMGQYANAVYRGKATLYASGTFSIAQQSQLCGVAGCTDGWKATENLLAVVAGAPTGDSVTVANYSHFQGAVYAVNDYREGNNSTVWGPVIANRLYLQNSTLNHYVPIGTLLPGMPATYEEVVTLTNEPGSWGS